MVPGPCGCDGVILTMWLGAANLDQARLGTLTDRQLGWGGTRLTIDQPSPMMSSVATETSRRD